MKVISISIVVLVGLAAMTAGAEDGQLFVRDVSRTPDFETDLP